MAAMAEFDFTELLPVGPDTTEYRLVTTDGVSTFDAGGHTFVKVEPEALTRLTAEAMHDIAHYLRPGHLAQLQAILEDPEASPNDRFVATELLQNANIAAGGVLPMCQDTGTAIVMGKKGQFVLTGGEDERAIARGIYDTYLTSNLRYSQLAPLSLFEEKNTGNNLPAQIELYATDGDAYKFLFMAKGGGSANKTYLFQETKALLNPDSLIAFLDAKLRTLGTSACPPYHLAVVIGGTSAEFTLKTAKYASARYLDSLPTVGIGVGSRLPRPRMGAAHPRADPHLRHRGPVRRQVLLPRRPGHPPAPPRRLEPGRHRGVVFGGPSGTRQDHRRGRVPRTARDRPRRLPARGHRGGSHQPRRARSTSNQPMADIRAELSRHPVKTRLSLTGTLVVGRDIVHAKIKDMLDAGEPMPQYLQGSPGVLRGPGQDPRGLRERIVRADDRRAHGQLRRAVPGRGRLAW